MLIRSLMEDDFEEVIKLGNDIHGKGYLTHTLLCDMFLRGIKNGIAAHAVAFENDKLIGFRLTYSAGNWETDSWCTPQNWNLDKNEVCYFKTNNVTPEMQGRGIGRKLLEYSIDAVKKQGAKAGVAHIWKESPNNSSVKYFSKAGARLIKEHSERWSWSNYDSSYECSTCGGNCECTACEMLLEF